MLFLLTGCIKQKDLNYNIEQLAIEERKCIEGKSNLIIVFKDNFEGNPEIDENMDLESTKKALRKYRQEVEQYYSVKNKELLDKLNLDFKDGIETEIQISQYTSCVFVIFSGEVASEDLIDVCNYLEEIDFVEHVEVNLVK